MVLCCCSSSCDSWDSCPSTISSSSWVSRDWPKGRLARTSSSSSSISTSSTFSTSTLVGVLRWRSNVFPGVNGGPSNSSGTTSVSKRRGLGGGSCWGLLVGKGTSFFFWVLGLGRGILDTRVHYERKIA